MKLTFRIWILIIILLFSLLAIFGMPPSFFEKGVIVKSVDSNSSFASQGLTKGEIIKSLNGIELNNFNEYSKTLVSIFKGNTSNTKLIISTNKNTYVSYVDSIPQIVVDDIPKTRIKLGLDLEGGARALVKPKESLTDSQMQDLIAVSNERFNVYGIQDVTIREVTDLSGQKYMLIEIAGATPKDLQSLIEQQGKFEAKIGNKTVFIGGDKDITYVARSGDQAGIYSCNDYQGGSLCNYRFEISLSEQAAKRHADITCSLGRNESNPSYLSKTLDFYVDDKFTTSLFISENLKCRQTTQIQIQGSGSGTDRNSAIDDAKSSMKKLQTILITGSLPYELEIVKLDTISPIIGNEFYKLIILTGIISLILVSSIIFLRYRTFKASLALLFISFSEILIILGIASFIKWNLDLPSIIGILITIGTGVDQQIVILDESKSKKFESMKQKLKGALFIIMTAYFTTSVSLLPLWWAGAGLLKGFMVTTLIGLTMGVLVTRPAFADIVKLLEEKNAS